MLPASAAPKPKGEVSCATTHSSHAAVAYTGKAKTCFNVSIHAPGLGSTRRIQGAKDKSTKGRDSPSPRAANMARALIAGWGSAAPSAGAMNGAVHGVATKVVSKPVKNDAR